MPQFFAYSFQLKVIPQEKVTVNLELVSIHPLSPVGQVVLKCCGYSKRQETKQVTRSCFNWESVPLMPL